MAAMELQKAAQPKQFVLSQLCLASALLQEMASGNGVKRPAA